jgi:IS30 family transposase
MISIEERPKEVADRTVPGHWEGDLLVGRNRHSALGSLVERTTRTVILVPLKSRKATEVRKAFAREALKLPRQMRLTMTYDQGSEMQQHRLFTKNTRMKVYFAHPASPWERGTNENTNGLIRDFFPKGTDLSQISYHKIKHVQHLLNGRPRKVLNFETPYDAFKKLAGVALNS